MKSVLIIFTFIITSLMMLSVFAQVPKRNDLQQLELKGNVKSLHETWYKTEVKSGQIKKGKRIHRDDEIEQQHIVFNAIGYKAGRKLYDANGKLSTEMVYAYDDKSNLAMEATYNGDGIMSPKAKFNYQYDQSGRVVEEERLKGDNSKNGTVSYKYDAKGNLIEKIWYKADGTVDMTITWKYDANGNLIESTEPVNKKTWRITYKYSDNGKVIEENVYRETKFIIKYVYSYDEKGYKSEVDWCKENGKVFRKWTLKHEYDRYGNWTQEVQFKNGKPTTITERTIEYL